MSPVVANVSHKLLLSAKPEKFKTENFYPLIIQIESGVKSLQIHSRLNVYLKLYKSDLDRITSGEKELCELICSGLFSENLLNELVTNKRFPIYQLLEDEKFVVNRVLEMKDEPLLAMMTVSMLEEEYKKYTLEITDVFDQHIKTAYMKEIRDLFLYAADKVKEKELFRLVDYLIHFINWDNSFFSFYDTSFDIIPGHIRKVENRLSGPLRLTIKAYLSFHAHVHTLHRLLEKREQGKISTLSLLDWQTSVKSMLEKQFVTFFGRKRSSEYIQALDSILKLEFKI